MQTTVTLSIFALYLGLAAWFSSFTADDAYIVYRYAENLVAGHGLVFNPGERVSALTSPLHALLSALLHWLTGQVVVANKLLSVAAVAGSTWFATRRTRLEPADRILALAFVLLCPMVVLWTVGGLETPYLLAFVCLAYALQPDAAAGRARIVAFSLCCGLCVVTRYDAVLFVGPLGLAAWWRRMRSGAPHSELWLFGVPIAMVVGGWLLFAQLYFHGIMPTSYYHKVPTGIIVEWLGYNLLYLVQGLVLTGLCVPLAVAATRWRRATPAQRARVRRACAENAGALAGMALVALYALQLGLSHMMFAYRMWLPYFPLAVLGALALVRMLGPEERPVATTPPWDLFGTLVAWQLGLALVVNGSSINPGIVGEYAQVSRRGYLEFLSVMERQAAAIETDWRQRELARPLRVYTYAAGLLPYRLGDAYVLDGGLISYRHALAGRSAALQRTADYVLTLSPRHGSVEEQVGDLAGSLQLLTRIELDFDGQPERFDVYFNPSPARFRLPATIDGPLGAPGAGRAGSPRRAPASRGSGPRRRWRRARPALPR